MQINFGGREATIKLVYYGPALSGKTTNLKSIHDLSKEESRGRLMTLETKDERTLFFDMLPIVVRPEESRGSSRGMTIRLKVFTVPGQVLHASTRRLVLQGADGVAFIADSQTEENENNTSSYRDLRENLKQLGIAFREMPLVLQFNKRDLPNVQPQSELEAMAKASREPVFAAKATEGVGVLETFFGLLQLAWNRLDQEHKLASLVGIPREEFVPIAAKQIGYEGPIDNLFRADLSGNLLRANSGETP